MSSEGVPSASLPPSTPVLAPPPAPRVAAGWLREWEQAQKEIQHNRELLLFAKRPKVEILRVNQLDAIKLDQEINEVLKMQFMKIFAFMKPDFVDKYQPELTAFMHFLIYRYSIFTLGTTYGNLLQNLKFRNEWAHADPTQGSSAENSAGLTSWQKVLYGVFMIGGEWCWARVNRLSVNAGWGDRPEDDWRRKAWNWLSRLENAHKLISIINFCVFLYNGKYVHLVGRLLGMRLVYFRPNMTRRVSFELMNRQLVWHGFAEFLLFLMPLINMDRIKSFLTRRFTKTRGKSKLHTLQHHSLACGVCNIEPAYNPYISSCGDIFCYYCLRAGSMADNQFPCPKCGETVVSIKRYSPLDSNPFPTPLPSSTSTPEGDVSDTSKKAS